MATAAEKKRELEALDLEIASLSNPRATLISKKKELQDIENEISTLNAANRPDLSSIGSFQAGLIAAGKGMTTIGRAGQQAVNFLTGDDASFQATKQKAQQEAETFRPLEELFPVSTFIGEVIGESAALPIGGVGTGMINRGISSVVAGATSGAATSAGQGSDNVGVTAALGGVLGPIGEAFGTLVSRFGGPAVEGINSIIAKKFGAVPQGVITPNGQVTKKGEKLLSELKITRSDFQEAFGGITDASRIEGLDPQSALRVARAQSQGVNLTEGQATRQFEIQSAEDILKGLEGKEGTQARLFFNNQQQALNKSKDKFLESLGGDVDVSRTARGEQVKTTIREINSAEKMAVSELYTKLGTMEGGNDKIKADVLLSMSDNLVREYVPSDRIQKGLANIYNDFEISPDFEPTAISQGPLTFKNAEKMRKRLNALKPDTDADISIIASIKQGLDDLVAGATSQFPENTPMGIAAKEARTAAAQRFDRFAAKDVIEDLISFKKGTKTNSVPDELVLDKILASGNKKLVNLRRVKQILTKNPTRESATAWNNIQTQAMLDVFGKAVTRTPDGEFISGAKLNTAIEKLGDETVKELFSTKQIAALRQLQSVVGDATIPVPKTTNPSGTGARMMNMISRMVTLPGLAGKVSGFISAGANAVKDGAERQMILDGIEKGASSQVKAQALLRLSSSLALRNSATEERERNAEE